MASSSKITDFFSHSASKRARQDDLNFLPPSLLPEEPISMDLLGSEADNITHRLRSRSRTTLGSEVESTDSLRPQSTTSDPCSLNESDSDVLLKRSAYCRKAKHRIGYDPEWENEFTWLEYSVEPDSRNPGMLCQLCRKHNMTARNKTGIWVSQPCLHMRKDKVIH